MRKCSRPAFIAQRHRCVAQVGLVAAAERRRAPFDVGGVGDAEAARRRRAAFLVDAAVDLVVAQLGLQRGRDVRIGRQRVVFDAHGVQRLVLVIDGVLGVARAGGDGADGDRAGGLDQFEDGHGAHDGAALQRGERGGEDEKLGGRHAKVPGRSDQTTAVKARSMAAAPTAA